MENFLYWCDTDETEKLLNQVLKLALRLNWVLMAIHRRVFALHVVIHKRFNDGLNGLKFQKRLPQQLRPGLVISHNIFAAANKTWLARAFKIS